MNTILASSNSGKLRELSVLLQPLGVELTAQLEVGIEAVPETGCTFVENALEKARHASRLSGLPAIADDSGLVVDMLNGAPGVYSARYAGENATAADNNRKLVRALRDRCITGPQRLREALAHFYCVIVFVLHPEDPAPVIATGRWSGRIIAEPRGTSGFGYDPHFLADGLDLTAAELEPDKKNRISHRGQAAARLVTLMAPGGSDR